ncbi:MAG: toxin-antitoxin system HicB family antitoxin [Verrucomicrobia bacterium]|nr:toxin-antitoxin system HicB family antitoxin [Verrucomicrobiota bacterium]
MKTIEAQIPEPVLKQAQELAARENVPLAQIISLAVAQAVGVWSNESYMAVRAKRASREKFLDALQEVPDVEPPDYDRLPGGYKSGE